MSVEGFGNAAKGLARNPLGIIALFIVFVYAFASLVFANSAWLTPQERQPFIWFLVLFPLVVFGGFVWLVSHHNNRLFAPSDFRNEDNYVKMAIALTAASSKEKPISELEIANIAELVRDTSEGRENVRGSRLSAKKILWVDDRPENNRFERLAFEEMGILVDTALSTEEAFRKIPEGNYNVIISDMGRVEGNREGYVLLDNLRRRGYATPLFFYASSNAAEHKRETLAHGGQGCTNNPQELFQMVNAALSESQRENSYYISGNPPFFHDGRK